MNHQTKIIQLDKIDLEHSPQVRAELNDSAVTDYSKSYKEKKPLPDCILFQIAQGPYLLADGRHRIEAMKKAGVKQAFFAIHTGDYQACLKHALHANSAHGVQRTNADKRAGVKLALQTFAGQSNGNIAEICDVGDDLVALVRKELENGKVIPVVTKRTGKDGKKRAAQPSETRVEKIENHENKGKSEDSKNTDTVPEGPSSNGGSHKTKPVPEVLDSTHYPIPPHPLEYWNRRGELDSLIQKGKEIKSAVARALEKDDRLFSAEIRNTFLSDIGDVISQLLAAVPYAVCPYCQGKLVKDCTFCKQRGIVGEMMYKTVPPELKKVRDAITRK